MTDKPKRKPPTNGRKGIPNAMPRIVKEAALMACELEGDLTPILNAKGEPVFKNGELVLKHQGHEGLVGWMRNLARNHPRSMAVLMRAIMPTQITHSTQPVHKIEFPSFETLADKLRETGWTEKEIAQAVSDADRIQQIEDKRKGKRAGKALQ